MSHSHIVITYLILKHLQDDKINLTSSEEFKTVKDSIWRISLHLFTHTTGLKLRVEMGDLLNASLVVREGILWTPRGIGFAATRSQGELTV
jgi:hypothetical protein